MVNRERMIEHVLSLIRIDSESRHEKDVALKLKSELESLGAQTHIDDADKETGSNTGNVIAFFKGTQSNAAPFLLSAHMDTVVPGKGIRPVRSAKAIKTSGDTILGGDDKTGLSVVMEALRTLKEKNLPHGDLEIVFTVCEEIGLLGAKAVDPKRLRSKDGLVLDSEFATILTTQGPAAVRIETTIHGIEAHAGVCPEQGLSAIKVAADAISKMKLGRIDKETTANIGVIEGGLATNIIPNRVHLKGEARSLDVQKLKAQIRQMTGCLTEASKKNILRKNGKKITAKIDSEIGNDYFRLDLKNNAPVVRLALQAAKELGYSLKPGSTGGGSDANVYNRCGIRAANLGSGMRDIHTVKEWIDLDDFERSANLVLKILALHAG